MDRVSSAAMRTARAFGLSVLLALWACSSDEIPEAGDLAAAAGTGPLVMFDMAAKDLPEIPLPNDVATFPDPTSRTGLRINVSLLAATAMEQAERLGMTGLEGWGTTSPITVRFKPVAAGQPAIDLNDVHRRMAVGSIDFADDPIYLLDLETGDPVPLDLGTRGTNLTVARRDGYGPNDPHAKDANLLFDTTEEGAGLSQADYKPELDLDQDGVLDHPNTFGPPDPKGAGLGDLLSWYERETDTLILRPVVPLRPKTKYAVVLTNRLAGPGGIVRSPFQWKVHPLQKGDGSAIARTLTRGGRREVYGNLASDGLAGISFAWTFTTGPVEDDLLALRDGLYGQGPFSRLQREFPANVTFLRTVGLNPGDDQPSNWQNDEACKPRVGLPYLVKVDQSKSFIHSLLTIILGFDGSEGEALEKSFDDIDYFAIGEFEAPYFLGTPNAENARDALDIDARSGGAKYGRNKITFWVSVPKRKPGQDGPFPVAVWSHGSTLHNDEMLIRAGHFAAQGMATVAINLPGHGLSVDQKNADLARTFLRYDCLAPWFTAASKTRATDIDHDGMPDSGALLWSTHMAHTRANVTQSVLDQMALTRLLRSFDGVRRGTQDVNGDGVVDLLGDLDGDGRVDLGGPDVAMTASGNSFGGIVAMVQGAIDPNIRATASISGGGAMSDVAMRSDFVTDAVVLKAISPAIIGIPASTLVRKPGQGDEYTRCAESEVSLRWRVADMVNGRELEIACMPAAQFASGGTVVLRNASRGRTGCARADSNGRFRVAVPANINDRVQLDIYEGADKLGSYARCDVLDGTPLLRSVKTWELEATSYKASADGVECTSDNGCQQFDGRFFAVGSELVAPQEGLGLARQTPNLRRLMGFAQSMLDAVDPSNYMRLYAQPGLDPWGKAMQPRGMLAFAVTGDPTVPNASTYAAARALGALPFVSARTAALVPSLAPFATPAALEQAYGGSPNDAMYARHAFEGLAWVGRTKGGPTCKPNRKPNCGSAGNAQLCKSALEDIDWLSEGDDLWAAPHPDVPFRLVREARALNAQSDLDAAWAPRLKGGFGGAGYSNADSVPLIGVVSAYIEPNGRHVWINPDPCNAFDETGYHTRLLARFLATNGRDVYFSTHPQSHRCLESASCDFFSRQ